MDPWSPLIDIPSRRPLPVPLARSIPPPDGLGVGQSDWWTFAASDADALIIGDGPAVWRVLTAVWPTLQKPRFWSDSRLLRPNLATPKTKFALAHPPVCESTTNQRQHQRYEIDTDLIAILSSEHEAGTMKGRSLNISEAGIAGVFVTGWEIGTPVLLESSVPVATRRVLVGAVVRNRSGYRYGFAFVNLSEEQREIISRTCRVLALLR